MWEAEMGLCYLDLSWEGSPEVPAIQAGLALGSFESETA